MYKVFKNNYFNVVKEFNTLQEARAYAGKMNSLSAMLLSTDRYFTI